MKNRIFGLITITLVSISDVFAGSLNTALQFDGVNDFVCVPSNSALSPQIQNGQMTISLWVNIEAGGGGQALAKGSSWTCWEYAIGIGTGVGFGLWTPGGGDYAVVSGGTLTPGKWHNVTGTYKKGSFVKVYLDGALVAQTTAVSMNPPIAKGNGGLFIGKEDHSSHPWNFKGCIDDVQLWNYAKTDAEVQQSYNMSLSGNEPGLVAYWNLNEGKGQIVNDSGHVHNGTFGTSINTDSADPLWIISDGTPHWNTEPTANAGQDQCVYAGLDGMTTVTLDGSDSNDPESDVLTFTWSYTVNGQVYEANGVNPTLNLPAGTHTITLIVNDGEFDSQADEVVVEVVAPLKINMKLSPVLHSPSKKLLVARFDFPSDPVGKIDPYSIALAADPNITADYVDLAIHKDSILNCNIAFESASIPSGLLTLEKKVVIFGCFKNGRLFYGEDKLVRSHNPK